MSRKVDELNKRKFSVVINGRRELEMKLEEFRKECEKYDKICQKKCKRRYYQLGLMAKLVTETTDDELNRLLKHGTRTFMIDTVRTKQNEIEFIMLRLNQAIALQQSLDPNIRLVTGLAMEIRGDCCRIGRMRNDMVTVMKIGDILTLSIDESYRYCCYKQIAYVINLKYYLKSLKLNDELIIGSEVHCKIVKKLPSNVAVVITSAGLLNSYDYIELPNQCYTLKQEVLPELFMPDLELAALCGAHYIVCPKIRCKPFLKTLRANLKDGYAFKLIGHIDLEFISSKMLDLLGIIKMLDFVWIPDMFTVNQIVQQYIFEDVIPICKCQKKPIIGSVPIERCSDFKFYENHDFLWKIDAIYMEKSHWCKRYPLIVKKLLPIKDFRFGVPENKEVINELLDNFQSIVNFIIRTVSTIECQAVILYSKCEPAVVALGRPEIYCPVYVMLPIDDPDTEACKTNLARMVNLRRNLRSVLYSKEQNPCNFVPIEFGIDYLRAMNCIATGDFIITVEVGKEDENSVQFGIGEDVVILRAYYLPPPKVAEKFVYSQPLPCQSLPRLMNTAD